MTKDEYRWNEQSAFKSASMTHRTIKAPPREPDAPDQDKRWGAWEYFVVFGGVIGFFAIMMMLPHIGGVM